MADLILAAGRGMAAAVGLHKRHSLALAGLALHTLAHHSRAARRKEAHSLVAARHSLVVACHTSAGAHIVTVCCEYLADLWIHMYRDYWTLDGEDNTERILTILRITSHALSSGLGQPCSVCIP